MVKKEVYLKVAEKLGYPGSAACVDYLKVVMTPEDGELLLEFIEPATCREVAKRLKVDEKSLQDKLDNFMRRGLLFHGKTQYVFQFGIHSVFNNFAHNKDENIPPDYYRVCNEFQKEDQERVWMPFWTLMAQSPIPTLSRVIPHRLALDASPKVKPEQILWYEDYHEILRREEQKGVIGVVDCPCRRGTQNCDRELWVCFHFGDYTAADRDPKRESRMKFISAEEAIALADAAEKSGLVHMNPSNDDLSVQLPPIACSCCNDDCIALVPQTRSGRLRQLVAPSRYVAVVNEKLCKGCKQCVSRCFFSAIEMRKTLTSEKKKAHVLRDNCMGCGSCVTGCKQKAITLELVRPPEFIPTQKVNVPDAAGTYMYRKIFGYTQAELK